MTEDVLTDSEQTKTVPKTSGYLSEEVMQRSIIRLSGIASVFSRGFRSTAFAAMPIKVRPIVALYASIRCKSRGQIQKFFYSVPVHVSS